MSNKTFEEQQQKAVDGAGVLMEFCKDAFDEPIDALFAMVVAIAAISKGIDMNLTDLFEGITLASDSMEKESVQ